MGLNRWMPVGLILLTGCSPSKWEGQIKSWGDMRTVMHDGQINGRVALRDVVHTPHAFGIGAVEGLRGEIVIEDGRCWTARVTSRDSIPTLQVSEAAPSLQATLLSVAFVPAWSESDLSPSISASELENCIRDAALHAGMDTHRPFPFQIEGQLIDLHAHVINGYCPVNPDAAVGSVDSQPFRVDGWSGPGKLIGLYAEDSAGKLTHHGTSLHMHVLVESPHPIVAHVEEVSLAPHARLRLPKQ